jgi:predicted RNA-binding protein YlqC (UPF0109 family)
MQNLSADDEQVRCLMLSVMRAMVDHGDDVRIETYEDEGRIVFELHVHAADLRTLIGKNGRMARCLRVLLYAAGKKLEKKYSLDLYDPQRIDSVKPGTVRRSRYELEPHSD